MRKRLSKNLVGSKAKPRNYLAYCIVLYCISHFEVEQGTGSSCKSYQLYKLIPPYERLVILPSLVLFS